MPYNGSGSFTRLYNWVNDRNAAVKIQAARMDAEMDGMATGLSTCVTKDGQTTTTARIPFAVGVGLGDGSVSAPAVNFTSDTNTGMYRIGADNLGFSLGGTNYIDLTTSKATVKTLTSVNLTGSTITPFASSVAHFANASGSHTFLTVDTYVGGAGSTLEAATFGRTARGTPASPEAVDANDYLYTWCATGHTGSGFTANSRARMAAFATEDWTGSATGTRFEWSVTVTGTTTRVTRMTLSDSGALLLGSDLTTGLASEKLYIKADNAGAGSEQVIISGATNTNKRLRYGIDTTANQGVIDAVLTGTGALPLAINPSGGAVNVSGALTISKSSAALVVNAATNTDPLIQLSENGSQKWRFTNDNTTDTLAIYDADNSAGVTLAQNAGSWGSVSDRRLAYKVTGEKFSVLDKLDLFDAFVFTRPKGALEVGVIAQDLHKAFPGLVTPGADNDDRAITDMRDRGLWTVMYDRAGVVALAGLKEIQAQLADLTKRVERLEAATTAD